MIKTRESPTGAKLGNEVGSLLGTSEVSTPRTLVGPLLGVELGEALGDEVKAPSLVLGDEVGTSLVAAERRFMFKIS
eukprot:CAMPEP_0196803410 /NCGR_PEP_ID=MMETSP1362-20130617/2808_1 /TAXON_ID=163516 /ORGANISM="Leptocylindrus danicus, Strain CCMP1856" /LENGTH=76 /DNA_ID=CAMNT_0042174969 /DNA_START=30 /DNA_END=257 /DNA_ORIENTATION=-